MRQPMGAFEVGVCTLWAMHVIVVLNSECLRTESAQHLKAFNCLSLSQNDLVWSLPTWSNNDPQGARKDSAQLLQLQKMDCIVSSCALDECPTNSHVVLL